MTADNPRFVRLDFKTNEAVEYKRTGDCNGCGECCRALIAFRVLYGHPELSFNERYENEPDPTDGGIVTNGEGIWIGVIEQEQQRYWQFTEINPSHNTPCPHLTQDNRCAVHFEKNRICRVWPLAPEHITPFPNCSYQFEEIRRWKLSKEKPAKPQLLTSPIT